MGGGKAAKEKRKLARAGLEPKKGNLDDREEIAAQPKADIQQRRKEKNQQKWLKRKKKRKAAAADKELVQDSKRKADSSADEKKAKKKAKTKAAPVVVDAEEKQPKPKVNPALSVFVGQLSWSADAKMVKKHFKEVGGITGTVSVRILKDSVMKESKGMAFVQLASEGALKKALKLDKSEIDGRQINVERSKARKKSVIDPEQEET